MIAHASATFRTGSHVRRYAVRLLLTGGISFAFFVLSGEIGREAGPVEFELDSGNVEASLTGCKRSDNRHGAKCRGLRTT